MGAWPDGGVVPAQTRPLLVSPEIGGENAEPASQAICYGTLIVKLSPQPQASSTLGLSKVNMRFRPSRV